MTINNEIIKSNPEKISENLIERAKKLSPSLLADAMSSFGTMNYAIKPVKEGMRVLGTAITVKVKPGDNLFLHKSIYLAGKGFVIVLDSNENKTCAAWGNMMTLGALAMGVEGVVLDGAVRDLAEIRELGLPIFASAAVPNGPTTNGPGRINGMITCGGVSVNPGDLIFGDDDGVVVVPPNLLEEVLLKAEAKAKTEEIRVKELAEGKLEPDWVREKVANLLNF
ncbi:MAG: ribonuclease inhibitor RraA/dimethylmenaquinone methyltransferase [Bacillota bacterium]|nr:ribonuclease inhibitor RraA/dimethylmenaquinone methyltransferase [Bacillota bacterium]